MSGPLDCQAGCTRLGIILEKVLEVPSPMRALEAGFQREVSTRALSVDRLAQAFDSYLHKTLGYSPVRDREERDREYSHLIGYNRDPAWLCPALRSFLPLHLGVITPEGAISFDGLHYADALLLHWPGRPVAFRRSEQAGSLIWVYLYGSILSQAMARELRRRDGSYRSQRPGR